jgi:hypothetical protein
MSKRRLQQGDTIQLRIQLGSLSVKVASDEEVRASVLVIAEVRDLARQHTRKAIQTLVTVMQSGESDSARVAAANACSIAGLVGHERTNR